VNIYETNKQIDCSDNCSEISIQANIYNNEHKDQQSAKNVQRIIFENTVCFLCVAALSLMKSDSLKLFHVAKIPSPGI
jgi:hypothetical protein